MGAKGKPFLSVIIPAYNEEKRLPETLGIIYDYLSRAPYSWEIIVADDGSKDGTVDLVKKFKPEDDRVKVVEAPCNMGKGAATRRGILTSSGKYRLFTDADNSTPISEVAKLLKAIRKTNSQIAIGSRAMKGSDLEVRQPWYRELMGRTFNLVVQTLAVPGIKDTQCGFKLFREDAALKLFRLQRFDGFSFDVELLFLARKFGFKIREVPIRWINNEESKVSPIKDSLRVFSDVIKIRFVHLTTKSQSSI